MGFVNLELSLTLTSLPRGPQTVFIISEPVPWLTLWACLLSESSHCSAGEDVAVNEDLPELEGL